MVTPLRGSVRELWTRICKSGEYDRIVGGSFVSRDEPVRPRAEASDAAAHYAERFRGVVRDATSSIEDVGKQINDWLRGSDENGG